MYTPIYTKQFEKDLKRRAPARHVYEMDFGKRSCPASCQNTALDIPSENAIVGTVAMEGECLSVSEY